MRTDEYAALVLPELDNLRAAYDWASQEGGDPRSPTCDRAARHCGSLVDDYAFECGDWLLARRAWVDRPGARGRDRRALLARVWPRATWRTRVATIEQAAAAQRAHALYRAPGGTAARGVQALFVLPSASSRPPGRRVSDPHDRGGARARAARIGRSSSASTVAAARRRARTPLRTGSTRRPALEREVARPCSAAHRRSPPGRRSPATTWWTSHGRWDPLEEAARVARELRACSAARIPAPTSTWTCSTRTSRASSSELGATEEALEVARIGWTIQRRTRSTSSTSTSIYRGDVAMRPPRHSCSGPPTRRCARASCARSTRRG